VGRAPCDATVQQAPFGTKAGELILVGFSTFAPHLRNDQGVASAVILPTQVAIVARSRSTPSRA
jgi:hypothetical protein